MKVYISGPITGTTDYMERFSEAQKHIESLGYSVINPALVNSTTRREKVQKNAVNCGMANRGEYIRNEKV